tara:strand:+ start:2974 stop:3123 length:150 start_codon:yes stop_codon:yes gene_type:complete
MAKLKKSQVLKAKEKYKKKQGYDRAMKKGGIWAHAGKKGSQVPNPHPAR